MRGLLTAALCILASAITYPAAADSFIADHPVGKIYEHSLKLPFTTVPLPEGKWRVISAEQSQNNNNMTVGSIYLVRVENNVIAGYIYIGGSADLGRTGWELDTGCNRNDVLFQQLYSYAQYDERCWILSHYVMTRGPNTTKAGSALWDFPANNNLALPSTMLGVFMRWHDGHTFNKVIYYFNPEFEGLPPSQQLDWRSSDWHRDRVAQSPERAAYVAKLKAWGEKQWQLFELGMHNKLPAAPVAAAPATTVQTNTPPPAEGRTPTERLQALKQLFDQKLITQEEYDRKKADIVKSM
jgi:hypothetical protein